MEVINMERSIENKHGKSLREILSEATKIGILSGPIKKVVFFNCHSQKYIGFNHASNMRVWGYTEYDDKIVMDMLDKTGE
jgi:hypothetical protein